MPKKRDNQRPSQPSSTTWVGLNQLKKWQREAASPEYAQDAFEVLDQAGKVTRMRYLELLFDMEAKYPGRGWKEQANDLEKFYYDRKLALNDHPRSRDLGS